MVPYGVPIWVSFSFIYLDFSTPTPRFFIVTGLVRNVLRNELRNVLRNELRNELHISHIFQKLLNIFSWLFLDPLEEFTRHLLGNYYKNKSEIFPMTKFRNFKKKAVKKHSFRKYFENNSIFFPNRFWSL